MDGADRSAQGDDRRRAQLLEAAGRVFQRVPAGGLTLAAVAEEAGVSKRLMYHYFADLRSLYDELLDARLAEQRRTVDLALADLADTRSEDRLAAAMRAFLALSNTDRRWALMALTDTLPPELAHRRGQLHALLNARWGHAAIFAPLGDDVKRTVMSMVVIDVCLLADAIDAGHLSTDHAVEIAVATATTIALVARATACGT